MLITEWPLEQKDTPVWIGFDIETKDDEERDIYVTDREEEASLWLLTGKDVGYLPEGLANPGACKWIGITGQEEKEKS